MMERQFTGTVFVVEDDKVLLIFHRKLMRWLPPGGHLDPNELPSEGAKREALEETGLEIELITQENVWVEKLSNCESFPRPYMCLLETIPGDPPHQHIDFIYVGRPVGGKLRENTRETEGLCWFTLEEVEALSSEKDLCRHHRRHSPPLM